MPVGWHQLAAAVLAPVLMASQTLASEMEFPPAKAGVWELAAVRTLPDGTNQSWTHRIRRCEQPSLLFRGYWGLAKLERAGCRYNSSKTADGRYRITSQCAIRGGKTALSDATVVMNENTSFVMDVSVEENNRRYVAKETGRHIADCIR